MAVERNDCNNLAYELNRRCGLDLREFWACWTADDIGHMLHAAPIERWRFLKWLTARVGSHPEFDSVLSDAGF